jgi:hypothetical protein
MRLDNAILQLLFISYRKSERDRRVLRLFLLPAAAPVFVFFLVSFLIRFPPFRFVGGLSRLGSSGWSVVAVVAALSFYLPLLHHARNRYLTLWRQIKVFLEHV